MRGARRRLTSSSPSESVLSLNLTLAAVCVISAGLANGLTQGLLSISPMQMEIKLRSGTAEEKAQAKRILPLITRHHFLLCTLMLFNATANEALPIFLDAVVPSWLSIVLSVTIVLLCGEILPGAVFTGPSQIRIASVLSPLTVFLLAIFSPISYPLSLLLDWALGHNEGMIIYNRYEIAAMMQIQHEETLRMREARREAHDSPALMQAEEAHIIDGALKFRDKPVSLVMTPVERVFALPIEGRLNFNTMAEIFKSGYSRIPIHGPGGIDEIVGLILVKDLIFIDPDDETPITNFLHVFGRNVQTVWPDQRLHEVLQLFRQGKGHLAIVTDVQERGALDSVYVTVGIITLEDIVAEILGEDIADETDTSSKGNRDIDFARLMTLIGPQSYPDSTRVSLQEAQVIANHLITTVPQVRELIGGSDKAHFTRLVDFVMHCPVFSTDKRPGAEELLFRRDKVSSTCVLVLHGRMVVFAGKEGFKVELGSWTVLGADALLVEEGSYVPDFTASIDSDSFRCLYMSRAIWQQREYAFQQKSLRKLGRLGSTVSTTVNGADNVASDDLHDPKHSNPV